MNGRCNGDDDVCLTHSSHQTSTHLSTNREDVEEKKNENDCTITYIYIYKGREKIETIDNELRELQSRTTIRRRHRLSISLAINIFYSTRT